MKNICNSLLRAITCVMLTGVIVSAQQQDIPPQPWSMSMGITLPVAAQPSIGPMLGVEYTHGGFGVSLSYNQWRGAPLTKKLIAAEDSFSEHALRLGVFGAAYRKRLVFSYGGGVQLHKGTVAGERLFLRNSSSWYYDDYYYRAVKHISLYPELMVSQSWRLDSAGQLRLGWKSYLQFLRLNQGIQFNLFIQHTI
ncbi:MAG: hypothetical protein JNM00_16060 [Flavobacteriales bacterium]|nr:hypothetical protein [Flavobacteriales bacterium]